jgi:hypothetical protein
VVRLLAVAVVLAFSLSGVAHAAPGKPSLYKVPTKVRPTNDGGTTAAFGWREVAFDGPGPWYYHLVARDLSAGCCTTLSTTVSASGDTSFDNSAALTLTPGHQYRIVVRAQQQNGFGPDSDSRDFVFDNTGPSVYGMSLTPASGWVRTLNIPVFVLAAEPTDAKTYQIDTTLSGWPCPTGGGDPACPLTLQQNSTIKTGNSTHELPAGDGQKYVFARFRDDAEHTQISRNPVFGRLEGNPGPGAHRVIGLDTTAPVAKLADATIEGVAGRPVQLDARSSTDASSGVKANGFEWRPGDGSGPKPNQQGLWSHTYPGPGTYNGLVLVRDNAGTPTNANDTNFSSTPFTVKISPAPVDEEEPPPPPPDPEPTPEPPPPPPAGPAPPPPPLDTTPLDPKPDIPLVGLPQTTKARKGPLAALEAPASAAPEQPIEVEMKLRRRSRVLLTMRDRKGRVIARKVSPPKRGTVTTTMRAPKKPGTYTLVAKAGERTLKLPIEVAKPG